MQDEHRRDAHGRADQDPSLQDRPSPEDGVMHRLTAKPCRSTAIKIEVDGAVRILPDSMGAIGHDAFLLFPTVVDAIERAKDARVRDERLCGKLALFPRNA